MKDIKVYSNSTRYAILMPACPNLHPDMILCGCKGYYHWEPVNKIGNSHIRTYQSYCQARNAGKSHANSNEFYVIKLQEVMYQVVK